MENAVLKLLNLGKIATFWFYDADNVLSIRVSSSRGKINLNMQPPKELEVAPESVKGRYFGYIFNTKEKYTNVIEPPSQELLNELIANREHRYSFSNGALVSAQLLLGWLNVFPDAVLKVSPEWTCPNAKHNYIFLDSAYGCAFIYCTYKKQFLSKKSLTENSWWGFFVYKARIYFAFLLLQHPLYKSYPFVKPLYHQHKHLTAYSAVDKNYLSFSHRFCYLSATLIICLSCFIAQSIAILVPLFRVVGAFSSS